MKTIRSEWESYAKAVLPEDVGSIQVKEMRRAFYAGARTLFYLAGQVGPDEVNEDAGVAKLATALHEELNAFNDEIKAGRA